MCMSMSVHTHSHVHHSPQWKSENSFEALVLSFHNVEPEDQTPVIRLRSKGLYPLNPLTGLNVVFSFLFIFCLDRNFHICLIYKLTFKEKKEVSSKCPQTSCAVRGLLVLLPLPSQCLDDQWVSMVLGTEP